MVPPEEEKKQTDNNKVISTTGNLRMDDRMSAAEADRQIQQAQAAAELKARGIQGALIRTIIDGETTIVETTVPDESLREHDPLKIVEPVTHAYQENGLVQAELPSGALSEDSQELKRLLGQLQTEVDSSNDKLQEAFRGKYPEVQTRMYLLSNMMHEIGRTNGYASPPWDKAWRQDGTPEAQRFWKEYLTRPFDQIVKEGFYACSDVATVYASLARGLSLDAHYVSAVRADWANGTQENDPNQHSFVEVRSGDETSLVYEPFEAVPKVLAQRTKDGYKLFIKRSGELGAFSYQEITFKSTSPEEDWNNAINQAYTELGYIPWRKGADPKDIGVKGLADMIEQVKDDFGMQVRDLRSTPDAESRKAFKERITKDRLLAKLQSVRTILGAYARTDVLPRYFHVGLVDEQQGVAHGFSPDIQRPEDAMIDVPLEQLGAGIKSMLETAEKAGMSINEEQARDAVLANASSVALHESIHQLIDGDPDTSPLIRDVASALEEKTLDEETNLLLNEGITYAFHNIFAPFAEPLGSMGPRLDAGDSVMVRKRKVLGQKIEGVVREYMQNDNKPLDNEFIQKASLALREVKQDIEFS